MVPELAGLAADQADQLGGYRISELAGAAGALGLTDRRFLGGAGRWRDSGMVTLEGVHAAAPPPISCTQGVLRGQPRGRADRRAGRDHGEVAPQVVVG